VLPPVVHSALAAMLTMVLAVAGECAGRWLFFVSVVPKNIAAAFASSERSAA
jgi:DMSO reductase anchor subunit